MKNSVLTKKLSPYFILSAFFLFSHFAHSAPKIAIIIDDLGYRAEAGIRAINLPGAITYAIIPFTPNALDLAEMAHHHGKEIMLHAPMSNINNLPLDPGALTDTMDRETFLATLQQGLSAIPYISGLNNHMGSQLTQEAIPMHWLMSELEKQQLYFIDSRTSANSVALDIAREHQLPSRERDVFLDHNRDAQQIAIQFKRLLARAQSKGSAIAIAHPYPETLELLERELPQLINHQIELVSVSQLLPPKPIHQVHNKQDTNSLGPH